MLLEIFSLIDPKGREFITEVVDLRRIIGNNSYVEIEEGDDVFYAVRENRKGHTKFVRNRTGEPSSKVVVVLKLDEYLKLYRLVTAYTGERRPHEPWNARADTESNWFWAHHALVWDDTYTIVEGSETDICPW